MPPNRPPPRRGAVAARRAHNPKVGGSNPPAATTNRPHHQLVVGFVILLCSKDLYQYDFAFLPLFDPLLSRLTRYCWFLLDRRLWCVSGRPVFPKPGHGRPEPLGEAVIATLRDGIDRPRRGAQAVCGKDAQVEEISGISQVSVFLLYRVVMQQNVPAIVIAFLGVLIP